ncbi:MAG: GTP-binding protein [Candidatus Hermodarchaeota archaeon]
MSKVALLEDLLSNFLNEVQVLSAALVVDLQGFIIAKKSIRGFDDELIGAIMTIIEQTLNKIKRYTETSFGSGTFDTNEFQLFYVELKRVVPAIFVLVADPYSSMNLFIPYAYIVAEKISLILNNKNPCINLPRLSSNGELIFGSKNNHINEIVIVGPEAVGKSTLVEMYCSGHFEENHKPTIGISIIKKELQISKDITLTFNLLDLGGIKSFAKIRKFYYKYSKVVLIIFDYSRIESFNEISDWIEESRNFIKNESIPTIIIGNKIDLLDNRNEIRSKAQSLAHQYNFSFFETSALTGEGIDELFTHLISILF